MIIIGKWAVLKLKYRVRLVNKENFSVSNNRQSLLSIILNFNLKITFIASIIMNSTLSL